MSIKEASFGYHIASNISNNFEKKDKNTQSIQKLSNFTGYISAICSIVLGILTLRSRINPFKVFGFNVGLLIMHVITKLYIKNRASQLSGIIFNKNEVKSLKLSPKYGECEALTTQHSADTELWRKRLIASAEHNIVISGNYCGGEAFIDFLKLIEKRIGERPQLKVVILSSPQFLTGKCLKELNSILEKYPKNISLVTCPSILHISPGIKQTTNHTKCMVIDYGRYFILGGSGIKDNFNQTGLDDLTKEEFLRSEGEPIPESTHEKENGLLGQFIPGNFRDQDWVFSSQEKPRETNPVGRQVYKQTLLLAHRWETYEASINNSNIGKDPCGHAKNLGLFTGISTPIKPKDTITTQLLKTPAIELTQLETNCQAFESNVKKATKVYCKVFASGPEQANSPFGVEVLNGIKKATKEIVINHMYFHPTEEIMDALIKAVQRGVKIKIITCGIYKNAPMSHQIFGPRNKYNYSYLMNALTSGEQKNVSIFEFRGYNTGNHKKLIVIDNVIVIAGSSNLGYKSLVTASDHELNFIAKSKKLAHETLKVCKVDEQHSQRAEKNDDEQWELSLRESYIAINHRILAPVIG